MTAAAAIIKNVRSFSQRAPYRVVNCALITVPDNIWNPSFHVIVTIKLAVLPVMFRRLQWPVLLLL